MVFFVSVTLFHKQLVLGWQIAKEQEGSTLFHLATKKLKIKAMFSFFFVT